MLSLKNLRVWVKQESVTLLNDLLHLFQAIRKDKDMFFNYFKISIQYCLGMKVVNPDRQEDVIDYNEKGSMRLITSSKSQPAYVNCGLLCM